jgi:flavin reductase (DIM6/NTAB) family NADH-FMN oxidoreductase RutF
MTKKFFDSAALTDLPQRYRAQLINCLSGYKSANLIGTADAHGTTNLSMVSSVVHLGANPPLLGMVMRPPSVPRDTYENILETGFFTVNHVHWGIHEQAHQTSARYPKEVSEFDAVGLTPEFKYDFHAPFVKESHVQLACVLKEDVHISWNDTRFLIAEIVQVHVPESIVQEDGHLALEQTELCAVIGLDSYTKATQSVRLPYAKP